jgi:hypothetical protein
VVGGVLHAALAAVLAVAAALGGDEEQVADDRRVALRRDALDGGEHRRLRRVAHVPDREAGEVALVDEVALERQVGVHEGQAARGVERRRLAGVPDEPHPLRGLAGVVQAGLEPVARVAAGRVGLRAERGREGQARAEGGERGDGERRGNDARPAGEWHRGRLRMVGGLHCGFTAR